MRVLTNDKNLCNDKWLSALVDAFDEVESERADDICRASYMPAGLMAQLCGLTAAEQRVLASRYELV